MFYLGTKYSTAIGASFLGADGAQRPIEMGCYGIGIARTVAAPLDEEMLGLRHTRRGATSARKST